jgi:hypothetical protein
MVNMALDFANLEGYELQPKKSVAIHIRGNNKQCETTNEKLNMGNITMPEVEQATHLGIIRTTTMKHTIGRASCPFYAAFRIVVQAFNNSPRFVLNSRNSNISFLEVHLERVATRSDWYAHVVFNRPSPIFCFHIVNLTDPLFRF